MSERAAVNQPIFRESVHQTITTGASGLSLPPRERTMTPDELIEAFASKPQGQAMNTIDQLEQDIRDIPVTVISGPPVDLTRVLAQHLHSMGYRKP